MSILTTERSIYRNGPESTGTPPVIFIPLKAGVKVYKGGVVATDATGYGVVGASLAATGLKVWGVAQQTVDNTAGASGALGVNVFKGEFPMGVLVGDPFTQTAIGNAVYQEDDTQVRATSNTSTRSAAGVFMGFDSNGAAIVRYGNFSQTGV